MARPLTLSAAIAVSLLCVSGAGGSNAQTPKRGGTLVFALPQPEPACLNEIDPRCGGTTPAGIPLSAISQQVLAAPFAIGGDFAWKPRLVTRATFTTRPPFVLTYRIRPEARWSDGVPVTAGDFVFTHRAIVSHGREDAKALHASVRSVRAVDAKTVRVVLRSRLGAWRLLFSPVLPSHALRNAALDGFWRDRIDDPRTGRAIGSGPFLVERWERGRHVALVRNPRYWGPKPHLDRLIVRFGVAPEDVPDALRGREVDVAYGYPPSFAPEVRRAGLRVVSALSTGWEHLEIRLGPGGNPLLRNKLVRRALAFGIDRAAIARAISRESGLAFKVIHSTVYLTQSPDYRPNWSRYRYRPAEARRLLEQAGCRRGSDSIYQCGGTRLSLRFFTHVSQGSIRPRVLDLIQAQLRPAGVDVQKVFAPSGAVFGSGGVYERGHFDVALFAWIDTSPGADTKGILGCGALQNYTGYCQRLVTRDLDQAERIFDVARQARVLNRADAQIAGDVPYVPLFQHAIWAGIAPDVRGFQTLWYSLLGAESWWLDR